MSLRPRGNNLWKRHVELYTDIFRQALIVLSTLQEYGEKEISISRQLNDLVQNACFDRGKEITFPICEVPIISKTENNTENKSVDEWQMSGRPDFTCRLKNQYASSYSESELDFHVECKCLGTPISSSWIYNRNYVNHGIMRFDQGDKRYGENVSNGMMIGYILSMKPDDICKEVNSELIEKRHNFEPICISSRSSLYEASQRLSRTIVLPSDFTLFHIWVVLQSK
ncbi:MAG: hypothetical protein LBG58_07285 [Planctomycetaceae bacterium]|jgi:hypothetical protein|nr:hypothetical protein [Planctomycetaceae bacterium]